jgi:hypothetical protein
MQYLVPLHSDGTTSLRLRGQSLVPLYPAAPRLAGRVPDLYDLLTLVDAIRVGRARERSRAAALLRAKLVPAS